MALLITKNTTCKNTALQHNQIPITTFILTGNSGILEYLLSLSTGTPEYRSEPSIAMLDYNPTP